MFSGNHAFHTCGNKNKLIPNNNPSIPAKINKSVLVEDFWINLSEIADSWITVNNIGRMQGSARIDINVELLPPTFDIAEIKVKTIDIPIIANIDDDQKRT